jgi:hypothetical protein
MSINAQPFNPTFKLIGNLAEDQILVFDVSENAFVNSTNSGGGSASGFTAIENVGSTGTAIHYGEAGTTLQLKKLIGGDNLTITDNGTGGLILAATNTDTIQDGTNLGTGTGLFSSKDSSSHALQFKSLAVGAGLTLTDDGAGTITLVNTVGAGSTDADLTLSNLSNVATARTNLDVYSKTETTAKFLRTDAHSIPDTNNVYDIGSPIRKYNDIYAETFQGTAVLAGNLTVSGSAGQVLTYNGSAWAAADPTGSTLEALSNVSNVVPADNQHLVWDAGTSLWTPGSAGSGGGGYQDSDARGAISVSGDLSYNSTTGVISFTQNDTWTNITGTPTTLAGYGITDAFNGTFSLLTGKPTTLAGYGITDAATSAQGALADSALQSVPAQTFASLTGKPTTLAGYGITDGGGSVTPSSTDTFTNKSGAISQWTNDSNYLTSVPAQTFASLTGKPTTLAGYGITDGGGSYANSNVDTHLNTGTATANQALVWTGTDYDWVTSTDSDTTYTAGTGLTLTGTEFSLTSGHFDGAYGSLTGAPTIPSGNQIIDWTSASAGTIHASNYTDTNTTYTAGSGLTLTGTVFSLTSGHFDGAFSSLSGVAAVTASDDDKVLYYDHSTTSFKWKAGGTPSGYNNTNWDTAFGWGDHSTQGYLTSVTSFSGNTFPTTVGGSNQIIVTDGAGNLSWVDSVAPQVTTNTNNIATLQSSSSNWNTAFGWGNHATAGYLTSETDSQTLSLSGTTLSISTGNNVDLGVLTLDDFADVAISSVSDGQFLTYNNGSGDWENSTVSIPTLTSQLTNDAGFITSASTYDNSDVDTHLNQSNPTSGYVLSWNGSDYAWVSNGASGAHYTDSDARAAVSATTGLSYNSGTGAFSLNSELSGLSNVSSSVPTSGQVLKWNGSAWAPAADVDTDTVYTTFTSDFDTRLATKSTANLSEDASNKYFTDARARSAITVAGDLTYNSATGVISFTETANYDNGDVDTHLNSGSAISGQILSWDGSDYDWINNDNHTPAWSQITSKPTTIAGFGITDAFDGLYSSLGGTPTTIAGYGITDAVTPTSTDVFTNKQGNISQWTNDTGYLTSVPAQTFGSLTGKPTTIAGYGITDAFDGAFGSLSGKPTTIAGYGITDAVTPSSSTAFTNKSGNISQWTNDTGYLVSGDLSGYALTSSLSTVATTGNYSDLSGTPTMYANSDVDSHLNQSNPTSGYVLSWNGSDYSWVAQSGGSGATDKIEEGNSSVEVIDGGADGHIMFNTNGADRWQVSNGGHILPEANATYDIGSADKKVRHLFLSDTSLYIGTDTLRTNSSNLLFNGDDVQDYANLKNKPDSNTAGTGIQINSGVISLSSTLSGLSNVSNTAPSSGQVLKWSGSEWAPGTDLASGTAAMNDLTDVSTAGISSGDVLSWNGSSFVASTPASGGASAINDLSDVDTSTSAPSNGDVLTWVQADSEWAPAAPSGGGGGSGATIEYFKLNYATNGNLSTISNATSGVSATILSATGGDVEVSFSSTNYPPAGIMVYGYHHGQNIYNIKNAHADMNTRKMSGGGSSGSPIAFGTMGSVDLTLDLREASTGSFRGFGTTTHAWVMFTTV